MKHISEEFTLGSYMPNFKLCRSEVVSIDIETYIHTYRVKIEEPNFYLLISFCILVSRRKLNGRFQ